MPRRVRSQPRVNSRRQPVSSSAFIAALEKAVAAEARRFNVSRSFVIATAVAECLGVDEQIPYTTERLRPNTKLLRLIK